jgi:hypothetical protein
MTAILGWAIPIAIWGGVTVGARGILAGMGLARGGPGDWGLAFPIGFSLYTILVYLSALAGIPIGPAPMLVSAALILLAGLRWGRRGVPERPPSAPWTPAEIVLLGALALYAVHVLLSSLYSPVLALDAHSYDGRARYLLHDGTLNLDLYHWPGPGPTPGGNLTYPPLFSLALATTYAFGGWQSKIVVTGFGLAWPLVVYGALRPRLPRFACLAWTLFLAWTPEVITHLSYALINLPAMALAAAEAVLLGRFVLTGRKACLAPAAVLGAGLAGVRADGLVVHAALWGTTVLFTAFAGGRGRTDPRVAAGLLLVALAPLLTWGTWSLYLRGVVGLEPAAIFGTENVIGVARVASVTWFFLFRAEPFLPVFYPWLLSLPSALLWPGADRTGLFYQAAALCILISVAVVFTFMKTDFGGGAADMLNFSYKRILFYLVPLAGLAAALSPPWTWLARQGCGWLHAGRLPTRDPSPEGRV